MNYTPEQEKAIVTTGKHISVSAGAGSGKTRVLVDRIVHLLEHEDVSISEIVAITFTRKAASEMKERLRKACYEKAPKDDARAMSRWRDILYQIDTARITTIDSFCSGLLREYALWMEDDPDYALMSESDMALLPKRIAQSTLIGLLDDEDAIALEVATEMGIAQTVELIVGLLNKPNLHEILVGYAAGDAEAIAGQWQSTLKDYIAERAQEYLGKVNGLDDVIDTPDHNAERTRIRIHDVCVELLGPCEPASILAITEELQSIRMPGGKTPKRFDEERYILLKEVCKEAKGFVKTMVIPFVNAEHTESSAHLTRSVAVLYTQVFEAYRQHKRSHSVKDFSDLLRDSLTLLETQPKIRDQIAGSIRYLMIDEFQDTNPAQWVLAQRLMRTEDQSGPELFIVGDAKQSIYRFRNADVAVFQEAQAYTAEMIQLNTNFRTVPNIMDWINAFFAKSGLLQAVADPWEHLGAHRPKSDQSGLCFLLNTQPAKSPAFLQRQTEAARIADHVLTLCTDAKYTVMDEETTEPRRIRHGDVALLFRAKSNMYLYENALKSKGISYVVLGGSQFYHRQEISDVMNLFQVLLDPWYEEALYGWLRSPMVALSDDSLVELAWQQGLAKQFYSDVELSDPEQHFRLAQARSWVQTLRDQVDTPTSDLLQYIIITTNYEAILLGLSHGEQRVRNVQKLLDTAREMTQGGKPHLFEFMQYLEEQRSPGVLEGDAPLLGEQQDAVKLMTIHASKGLEFPVVVLPDTSTAPKSGSRDHSIKVHTKYGVCIRPTLDEGESDPAMYSYLKAVEEAEEKDEDARVLYVAMTRARDHLVISGTLLEKRDEDGEVTEVKVAGGKSWLAAFAQREQFDLLECDHGEQNGYTVLIEAHGTKASGLDVLDTPSREAIPDGHIEPLIIQEPESTYVSTTGWLDKQFPGPEHAESENFNPEHYRTLQRGTIVHRYFELWDFEKDTTPDITVFFATEYPAHADDASLVEALGQVVERFTDSPIRTLLSEGAPLQRELPFVVPHEGQWISGTIDVMTAEGVIVDYKTGAYREASLPRYEAQLRLYAQAIEQLTGTKPTAAWVYFVESGRGHEVVLY